MDLRHVDLHISEQKLTIKSAFFKSYFINSSIVRADLSHYSLEIHKEKVQLGARENFLGLAIILTLKRGSVSQAVDP